MVGEVGGLVPIFGQRSVLVANVVDTHVVAFVASGHIFVIDIELAVGTRTVDKHAGRRATHGHALVVSQQAAGLAVQRCAIGVSEEGIETAILVGRVEDKHTRGRISPVGHIDLAFAVDADAVVAAEGQPVGASLDHALVVLGPVGVINPQAVVGIGVAGTVADVDASEVVALGAVVHGVERVFVVEVVRVVEQSDGGDVLAYEVHGPVHLLSGLAGQLVEAERDAVGSFFHVGNFHFAQHLTGLFVGEDEFGALGVAVGVEVKLVAVVEFRVGQAISKDALHGLLLHSLGCEAGQVEVAGQVSVDLLALHHCGGCLMCCGCHISGCFAHGCRLLNRELGVGLNQLGILHAIGDVQELDSLRDAILGIRCHHDCVLGILEAVEAVAHQPEVLAEHLHVAGYSLFGCGSGEFSDEAIGAAQDNLGIVIGRNGQMQTTTLHVITIFGCGEAGRVQVVKVG